MGKNGSSTVGRVFTLELNLRSNVREVAVPGGSQRVVIEGTIGALRRAEFVDETVLEVRGSGGVLRVDLSPEDLAKAKSSGVKGRGV